MTRHHFLPLLFAAALPLTAAAQVGGGLARLVENSPFAPPAGAEPGAAAPAERLELRGIATIGGVTSFSFFDATANRSFWVGLNQSEGGVRPVAYDPATETVTIEGQGGTRRLALKEVRIQTLVAPPAPAVAGGPGPAVAGGEAGGPAVNAPMPSEQEIMERRQRIVEELRRRRALRQQQLQQTPSPL